jgi:hypothetical protein
VKPGPYAITKGVPQSWWQGFCALPLRGPTVAKSGPIEARLGPIYCRRQPFDCKGKTDYRCGGKLDHSVRPRTVGVRNRTATFSRVEFVESVRNNTERPRTVLLGTNILVGADGGTLGTELGKTVAEKSKRASIPPLRDGHTGEPVADVLCRENISERSATWGPAGPAARATAIITTRESQTHRERFSMTYNARTYNARAGLLHLYGRHIKIV